MNEGIKVDFDREENGLQESAGLNDYTPDDIEKTEGMDAVNATTGSTLATKNVVEFEDETQSQREQIASYYLRTCRGS